MKTFLEDWAPLVGILVLGLGPILVCNLWLRLRGELRDRDDPFRQ